MPIHILLYSIAATSIISVISLLGAVTLSLKDALLKKLVFYLVAVSAGSLMGNAFLHLMPEALESAESGKSTSIFIAVLAGFGLFFILERVLHWHHFHQEGEGNATHPFTYLNLIGDGFHNFIDGIVIIAAFSLNVELGIATTLSVIIHEIPQEISDFGVLIYGGFTKSKALLFNLLSAAFAILGTVCGYALINTVQDIIPLLAGVTAGGFIYISASDLIPELHKETNFSKSLIAFMCFFGGVGLMALLKFLP